MISASPNNHTPLAPSNALASRNHAAQHIAIDFRKNLKSREESICFYFWHEGSWENLERGQQKPFLPLFMQLQLYDSYLVGLYIHDARHSVSFVVCLYGWKIVEVEEEERGFGYVMLRNRGSGYSGNAREIRQDYDSGGWLDMSSDRKGGVYIWTNS